MILISAHNDLAPEFSRGRPISKSGKYVKGALDNALGMYVLLESMFKFGLPKDIYIEFPDGEETDFSGAFKYGMKHKSKIKVAIAVDVTIQDPKYAVTVENYTSTKLKKAIKTIFKEHSDLKIGFVPVLDGCQDEANAYRMLGIPAFSIGIPIESSSGSYHTPMTKVKQDNILRSSRALSVLINGLYKYLKSGKTL